MKVFNKMHDVLTFTQSPVSVKARHFLQYLCADSAAVNVC